MSDDSAAPARRSASRLARVARGFLRPSTRSRYVAVARQRIGTALSRAPLEICVVCGSRAARVLTVTQAASGDGGPASGRTLHMRVCRSCGHVDNRENVHDYRSYERLEALPDRARIGTADRKGREFHMAAMAIDILGRNDLEVLVFGAGRSFDNHHIAALPQVRHVAIADVMKLRDDAEFIDANLLAPRRFAVVVASEVVEHFLDPRHDFAQLLGFVEPGGILVCSTNLYDGGNLATQRYAFLGGHTSYYSAASIALLAEANGYRLDLRTPLVATGYGGRRKRYLILSTSEAVMAATARYFSTRRYAPSESPTADQELAEARRTQAAAADAVTRAG
ncbi:MAG: hypothetical protein A2Z32_11265 [Chloroflexi bacterium RBG_16_69_14]|nr:MAG: hypothetical protein A2Z32_11265 [Chloroflexi bacterium RBG_16_69_14]